MNKKMIRILFFLNTFLVLSSNELCAHAEPTVAIKYWNVLCRGGDDLPEPVFLHQNLTGYVLTFLRPGQTTIARPVSVRAYRSNKIGSKQLSVASTGSPVIGSVGGAFSPPQYQPKSRSH